MARLVAGLIVVAVTAAVLDEVLERRKRERWWVEQLPDRSSSP